MTAALEALRNAAGGAGVSGTVWCARLLALLLAAAACATDPAASAEVEPRRAPAGTRESAVCPTTALPAARAPDVTAPHRDVHTWLERLPPGAADEVLVDPDRAALLTERFTAIEGAWRDPLAADTADPERVRADLEHGMLWMAAQVASGAYLEGVPGAFEVARRRVDSAVPVDEVRLVVEESPLYCMPFDSGLFKPPADPDFDRNRCASLHPGELVRVVARSSEGDWVRAHAGHTAGWLHDPVLTAPQPRDAWRAFASGRHVVSTRDDARTEGGMIVRLGVWLPVAGELPDGRLEVLVPSIEGPERDEVRLGDGLHAGGLPLTRRALWTAAFAELDAPYGWGGRAGARDCSRLVRDLFATFGLQLPRHSGVQAQVGTHDVDVAGNSDADKLAVIDHWAARGIVLLYMPGHIMIHLGKDGAHHYAISAISEYVTPCPGGPDTVHRLDRVAVTTLELGRGTERTSYVERITRLVVFTPDDEPAPSDAAAGTPG